MFKFQRHANDLTDFYQKRYKVNQMPQIVFQDDQENSKNVLGRTGQYDPHQQIVTIFVTGRHGKDILRSLAHELIHHLQNERGDLANVGSTEVGYAQNNSHMRNMEREAYEQGNLCLRDWEDHIKTNNIQLYETIYKADKTKGKLIMSVKQTKQQLNEIAPVVVPLGKIVFYYFVGVAGIVGGGMLTAHTIDEIGRYIKRKATDEERKRWGRKEELMASIKKNPKQFAAWLRDFFTEQGQYPAIIQGDPPEVKVFNTKEERTKFLSGYGTQAVRESKDKTKGDSVMSIKEQRNVKIHNKLMEAWGFKAKEEGTLLTEGASGAYNHIVGDATSEKKWPKLEEEEELEEDDDSVSLEEHPMGPGKRTVNNKNKVEESIRKAIRNILHELA
jgi:hypothetical protein